MNPLTIDKTAENRVSEAVLWGDFDAYAALIDLPALTPTREGLQPTPDAATSSRWTLIDADTLQNAKGNFAIKAAQ